MASLWISPCASSHERNYSSHGRVYISASESRVITNFFQTFDCHMSPKLAIVQNAYVAAFVPEVRSYYGTSQTAFLYSQILCESRYFSEVIPCFAVECLRFEQNLVRGS